MHVMHIIPASPFGGLQRLVIDLASEQVRLGLSTTIISLYHDSHTITALSKAGLPFTSTHGRRFSWRGVIDLVRLVHAADPDIIHLHAGLLWANAVLLVLRRRSVIVHLHGYTGLGKFRRGWMARRLLARLGRRFIAVSQSVADDWRRNLLHHGATVDVVPNGIRMPERCSAERSFRVPPRIGCATRLAPDKGVFEFLEVCAAIARRRPDVTFHLAGDGPLLGDIRERISQLGLQERLTLHGFMDEMDEFIKSLSIVLFLSRRESFGLGLIEPVSLSVPVIAYRNDSGSDEVIDNCRGVIGCEWNNPEQIASIAIEIIDGERNAATLIKSGQNDIIENFSIERCAAGVNAVYFKALGRLPEQRGMAVA